ncbi:MAG: ribonuclease P protein component [Sphingobacteriaceae bacterium]
MYTFKKEERLCSQKLLDKLFHNGSSFLLHPFRVIWLKADEPQAVAAQVVIQVAKRRFKRAVDRNLIKRRIREVYRLHKASMLYSYLPAGQTLLLGINYVGQDIPDYHKLEEKLKKALKNLEKEYQKAAGGQA